MNALAVSLIGLTVLTAGTLVRVLIGPTVWDRLLGIGLTATKITLAAVVLALYFEEGYFVDVALILAIIGFLAKLLIARYIERSGDL